MLKGKPERLCQAASNPVKIRYTETIAQIYYFREQSIYRVAYRFYAYQSNGQHNPDGSPCQGILYRSLDLRSYADQNWLQIQHFQPGCACLIGADQIPVNFFEPQPLKRFIS